MEQDLWRRNHERGIVEGEACKRNHRRGIMKEEASGSIRGYLGSIWEASKGIKEEASGSIWGYLGGIWEASKGIWKHLGASGGIKGRSESGGAFTIVKMQSNRRERPFYRRMAKVGGTKYRKTHGSSEGARPELTRGSHSPTITHAARNPTGQD